MFQVGLVVQVRSLRRQLPSQSSVHIIVQNSIPPPIQHGRSSVRQQRYSKQSLSPPPHPTAEQLLCWHVTGPVAATAFSLVPEPISMPTIRIMAAIVEITVRIVDDVKRIGMMLRFIYWGMRTRTQKSVPCAQAFLVLRL